MIIHMKLQYYLPYWFFLCVVGWCGCQSTILSDYQSEAGIGVLEIDSEEALTVGFFEERIFRVELTGSDGMPLVGQPVMVSFIGSAHNGRLFPSSFNTDENGRGDVLFTAPDKEGDFQIRFSSPVADTDGFVSVTVDPARIGLSVDVNYAGKRNLTVVDIAIYKDISCEDLQTEGRFDGFAPFDELTDLETSSFPVSAGFSGLHYDATYCVSVSGRNPLGAERAAGCIDGLIPDLTVSTVQLSDVLLDAGGKFKITTRIDTDGLMDKAVDEFALFIDSAFLNNPPKKIMDGISKVLDAKDPFAAEAYLQLRQEFDFELFLAAELDEELIAVRASFSEIWDLIRAQLDGIEAQGTLELVSQAENSYRGFHSISQLNFSDGLGQVGIYLVELESASETGETTAVLGEADRDSLSISRHKIGLGLGTPLFLLFSDAMDAHFSVRSVSAVLDSFVNCDHVADLLVEKLSEVADRASIHAGCVGAAMDAEQALLGGTAVLNTGYANMILEGGCRLETPEMGNQVLSLVDGYFSVSWTGFGMGKLGPMEASFDGELSSGP